MDSDVSHQHLTLALSGSLPVSPRKRTDLTAGDLSKFSNHLGRVIAGIWSNDQGSVARRRADPDRHHWGARVSLDSDSRRRLEVRTNFIPHLHNFKLRALRGEVHQTADEGLMLVSGAGKPKANSPEGAKALSKSCISC